MSTQKAYFSYEEVIDLHTESDRVSVIGIHTPTGDTPRKLCPGFFQQFKKYKYLGCKLALVPAATLPADPSQISYGAGEAPIDMRDVLNPILFHGCHGNDIGDILNRLYAANAVTGDSTTMHLGSDAVDMLTYLNGDLFPEWDQLSANISFMESLYYRALTDRTWKKANVQRGFRIAGLRPRVYSLASTMQISGTASLDNIGQVPAPFEIDGEWQASIQSGFEGSVEIDNPVSNANRFLTPRTIPLGWLDTRNVLTYRESLSAELEDGDIGLAPTVLDNMVKQATVHNELPKIFMGVILLPPAYKQEFYFRMIVTHYFAFAGFRGCSMSNDMLENPNYHDWNDQISSGEGDEPEPDPEPEPTTVTGTALYNYNGMNGDGVSLAYTVSIDPNPDTTGATPLTASVSGSNAAVIKSLVPLIDGTVTATIANSTANASIDVYLNGSFVKTIARSSTDTISFNPAESLTTNTLDGNTYANSFLLSIVG